MKSESNRPISVDDLLRLKRAERPPAEFWTTFDQQLRAKQLAALVTKRPWWQDLPSVFRRLSRYHLALGATAVVAITYFSVREDTGSPSVSIASQGSETLAEHVPVLETEPAAPVEVHAVPDAPAVALAAAQESAAPTIVAAASEFSTDVVETAVYALGGAGWTDHDAELESPAARHIAANLASVQVADLSSARRLLDVANGFEARAMPARAAVEPLQQMTPPSESRRTRILTAMVSTAALESSMRTTERAASRIDEERLYDQIHRFGARGDRVHVKF